MKRISKPPLPKEIYTIGQNLPLKDVRKKLLQKPPSFLGVRFEYQGE